jgi:hypothetical protein
VNPSVHTIMARACLTVRVRATKAATSRFVGTRAAAEAIAPPPPGRASVATAPSAG